MVIIVNCAPLLGIILFGLYC